ncbi:MAG: MMPL family transporter [Bacilli bacterium]|nr:MMPL family transporter [Bacilli bacterium]
MKKIADNICKHKTLVLIITSILFLLSLIGAYLTKINYDILVYLPSDIETVKGQNILTEDFNMGSYAFVLTDNMSSKDILQLEENIKNIEGVNEVVSIYDLVGTTIPVDMLPNEITSKLSKDNTDLIMVTLNDSTSSLTTMNAISELRKLSNGKTKVSGMSSMVLDTKELSDKEIAIYVVIAVLLCLLILELSLNSYVIPVILLANIGISIMINLGTNIIFGEISYITKALVAVLQLGVTTDFSIFLYHSYEKEKALSKNKEEAMSKAITETFTSVLGSSLTTIAGFLVLCTMSLTLGMDLGLVMAKGVLIGVISAITLFPCLILTFDKLIEKTHHKELVLNFDKLNNFVIKHNKVILIMFVLLAIPLYLANSKVEVYYKLDQSLPETLESIQGNNILKEKFNIVSPEIILMDKDIKNDDINKMIDEIKEVEGIDFVLSSSSLSNLGITNEMLPSKLNNIIESENYQLLLVNSTYDIATDELNNQVDVVNKIIKKYDKNSILAGEGPLMKDLVNTSDTDFNNVNYSSMICILLIMFIVLKSLSLPFLLILTIEFAIITNMSVSYFSGTVLPFVAPIVLGTIQLGATIDYAILMTTNYIKRRRDGMDKNKSMKETLGFCNNSIIVSGMCFFAATFGVGVYSKLEMVASLCTLISRGALISMFTVIVILPCVLLTFDKIVMKTTKI